MEKSGYKYTSLCVVIYICVLVQYIVGECESRRASDVKQTWTSHESYGASSYAVGAYRCVAVEHAPGTVLVLEVQAFELQAEYWGDCSHDYLSITADFPHYQRKRVGSYCGRVIFQSANFYSCNVTAIFISDYSLNYNGFLMSFHQVDATGRQTNTSSDACHVAPPNHVFPAVPTYGTDSAGADAGDETGGQTGAVSAVAYTGIIVTGVLIITIALYQHCKERRRYAKRRAEGERVSAIYQASDCGQWASVFDDDRSVSTTSQPQGAAHDGFTEVSLEDERTGGLWLPPRYDELQPATQPGLQAGLQAGLQTGPGLGHVNATHSPTLQDEKPPDYHTVLANKNVYHIS